MNKIIAFVVVATLISLVTAGKGGDRFEKARNDCLANPKVGLSEESIRKVKAGEKQIDDPNKKRFSLCMTKEMGLIDENNKLVKEEIKKGLAHLLKDDSKVEAALTECAVEKDNIEETGYALWKCIHQKGNVI